MNKMYVSWVKHFMPLDRLINNYLAYLEIEKGCAKNTIKGYSHDLTSLVSFFEKEGILVKGSPIDWKAITLLDLRSFLAHLHSKDNKQSSIHRRVCSIKGLFGFLQSNKVITEDPAMELSYPKRPKSLPKFLSTTDVEKLLNTEAPIMHKTILEVLYSTGARCNEIRTMNIDDVEIETKEQINELGQKVMYMKGHIMIRGGKGGKDRVVLLTNRAAQLLNKYMLITRKQLVAKVMKNDKQAPELGSALFLSNRGKRVATRTIQHFLSKISEKAGVKHTTPHMIRHSFASHLVMNKTSIRAIQQLLGHSSLDTTQIYANISPEFLREEFDGNLPFK